MALPVAATRSPRFRPRLIWVLRGFGQCGSCWRSANCRQTRLYWGGRRSIREPAQNIHGCVIRLCGPRRFSVSALSAAQPRRRRRSDLHDDVAEMPFGNESFLRLPQFFERVNRCKDRGDLAAFDDRDEPSEGAGVGNCGAEK